MEEEIKQLSLFDLFPEDYSYNRKGEKVACPKWVQKNRCEKCQYWNILPEGLQPAEGWGVKGSCTSHRGQGRTTDAFSYCGDYEVRE